MAANRQQRRFARPARPERPEHGKSDAFSRDAEQRPRANNKPDEAPEYLFQHAVMLAAANAQLDDKLDVSRPHELLAPLEYEDECRIKTDAVRAFWTVRGLPSALVPRIVPSPVPRGYRATSKRRVYVTRGGELRFCMGYGAERGETLRSELEPESHNEVYAKLRKLLASPVYRILGRSLNFIVVRGGAERLTLILNFFHLDAAVMRKAKLLANHVREELPQIAAMFTFLDETRSEFYLESRSAGARPFKKLFGSEYLDLHAAGCKFLYPPSAFSQVNESILDAFLREAGKLLAPGPNSTLVDLFTGYGLFAVALGDRARRVVAMDFNGPAIHAASGNAEHNRPGADIEFIASAVTPSAIENKLPPSPADLRLPDDDGPAPEGELFLLDPPRSGVRPNVIAAIAKRSPARILHVFCSADEVAPSLAAWKHNGYSPAAVRIFDMFPGSPNVETMVLLEKTKKKPAAKNKFAAKGKPAAKQDPAVSNRAKKRLASRGERGARRASGSDRPGKPKSAGKPHARR